MKAPLSFLAALAVSAGTAGAQSYNGTQSAGSAVIGTAGSPVGQVQFYDSSTADTATITGGVWFQDLATAGSATIISAGKTGNFWGQATAGSANFTNDLAPSGLINGNLHFNDSSSAGSAIITNSGHLYFHNSSTAGSASITNTGDITFEADSSAGSASIINDASGLIALGSHNGPISFGSIAGNGTLEIGATDLIVGGLNTSTTFSGFISRLGFIGGTATGNGSLTKIGTGTLTLSGSSGYSGGTNVNAGTLLVSSTSGPATGSGAVWVASGATLGGSGFINGLTTLTSGAHLAPGDSPGTLTFNGGLTLNDGAILDFQLGTSSDLIAVTGGTLTGSASAGGITLNLSDSGGFAPATYVLFDFTGASLSGFDSSDFTLGTTISGYDYAFNLTGTTLELIVTASAIPEPSTYAMFAGLGALGLVIARRKRLTA